jgi:hypothetical protein
MEQATYQKLIDGATEAAKASKIGYGLFTIGAFQIYAFPVQQRTTIRNEHYRYTHYMAHDGRFARTNKATFLAALEAQPNQANDDAVSIDGVRK